MALGHTRNEVIDCYIASENNEQEAKDLLEAMGDQDLGEDLDGDLDDDLGDDI